MRFIARGFFKLLRRSICLTVISCRHWEVVPSKVGKFLAAPVVLFRTSSATQNAKIGLPRDVNVVRKTNSWRQVRVRKICFIKKSTKKIYKIINLRLINSFISVIKYLTQHLSVKLLASIKQILGKCKNFSFLLIDYFEHSSH